MSLPPVPCRSLQQASISLIAPLLGTPCLLFGKITPRIFGSKAISELLVLDLCLAPPG